MIDHFDHKDQNFRKIMSLNWKFLLPSNIFTPAEITMLSAHQHKRYINVTCMAACDPISCITNPKMNSIKIIVGHHNSGQNTHINNVCLITCLYLLTNIVLCYTPPAKIYTKLDPVVLVIIAGGCSACSYTKLWLPGLNIH